LTTGCQQKYVLTPGNQRYRGSTSSRSRFRLPPQKSAELSAGGGKLRHK